MFENPDHVVEAEEKLDLIDAADTGLNLPTQYLSYSQINLYGNCGERYRRKYVLENRQPGSSNMAHGRLMHKVVEKMLLYKRKHNQLPDHSFHHDTLSELIDEYFEDVETWDPKIPDMVEAEEASRVLLDIYYSDRLPEVAVRDVERRIRGSLRGYIPFVGYVDLIEKGPMDVADTNNPLYDPYAIQPTDRICDTKVTGRNYPKGRVANSMQLSLYSEMLGVEDVGFDLLVRTKKKRSSFKPHRSSRSRQEKEHALDVAEGIAQAISAGVFLKTDPEHWMCSEKWCPFWDECRGKSLQVPVEKAISNDTENE